MLYPSWDPQLLLKDHWEQQWPKWTPDTLQHLREILFCFPARISDLPEKGRIKLPLSAEGASLESRVLQCEANYCSLLIFSLWRPPGKDKIKRCIVIGEMNGRLGTLVAVWPWTEKLTQTCNLINTMGDRERKVPFVFLAGVRRVRLEPRCVGASQRASLPRELALPFWET